MKVALFTAALALASTSAQAQLTKINPNTVGKFTLAAGLSQPLILKGYNIAGAYFTERVTFEWSHGWSLNPPLSDAQKKQNLEFEVEWTTGPGIGYRLTNALDTRLELKAHHYAVDFNNENAKIEYTTYTVGAGAYYRIYPFKKGILRGLLIEPNLRWWPMVGSTLSGGEYRYTDAAGLPQAHKPIRSDFIYNMNIAWTFGR
jgi:hypothetical protein